MTDRIKWETDYGVALGKAREEKKPVLLDFFSPTCIGCQQMDAVTYPDDAVGEFLNKAVIPVRIRADTKPLSDDFNIKWTPTLVTVDWDGKEHHRTVGFLPPEEFIPSMLLGVAKVYFDLDRSADALTVLDRIISDYGASGAAPEAVFLKGVSGYKSTHETTPLKEAYKELQAKYPASEWAKRALPYRLLP